MSRVAAALGIAVVVCVSATPPAVADVDGIRLAVVAERSIGRAPGLSLAPDLRVAFDDLELSLVTSHRARWLVGTGFGYCVDCDELTIREPPVFSGTGFAARWRYAVAGIHFDAFSPLKPWLQLGSFADKKWRYFEVSTQPYLGIAVANRDDGNASFINVPVRLRLVPLPWLRFALEPAFSSRLSHFTDWYAVAIGAGIELALPGGIEVSAYLGMPQVYGQLNDSSKRHATVLVSWEYRPALPAARSAPK